MIEKRQGSEIAAFYSVRSASPHCPRITKSVAVDTFFFIMGFFSASVASVNANGAPDMKDPQGI
jgi:hypothetical protein